jgi:hypothetical protein
MSFSAADPAQRRKIVKDLSKDLESFTATITGDTRIHAVCCAVCDSMPKKANDWSWVEITKFKSYAEKCRLHKKSIREFYPEALIDYYTASNDDDHLLSQFVLSPSSLIDTHNKTIAVCNQCLEHLESHTTRKSNPPIDSIVNGYLIGTAPVELKELSEVELSIISQVRITCHTFVFYAGCHRSIRGWHTLFKNKPAEQVANMSQISEAGLKGQIVVVLCGPFTTTQKALALQKTAVRPDKVVAAFRWLQANNFHYKDIVIPDPDDLPVPFIIEEGV